MKKLLLLLAMLVVVLIMSSFERSVHIHFVKYKQNHIVSGRVTDCNDKVPIPGVSVTVKGTLIGVLTDANGEYSISVPPNYSYLRFSYVGMPDLLVYVGNISIFNPCLSE